MLARALEDDGPEGDLPGDLIDPHLPRRSAGLHSRGGVDPIAYH
jgi:hypothetical protein